MEVMLYILRGAIIVISIIVIPILIGSPIEAYRTGNLFNKENWHEPFNLRNAWGYGFFTIGLLASLYVLGWISR